MVFPDTDRRDNGFTLVEIIASLLLIGIAAAIAGLGIASGISGYAFSKANVVIAQDARIAMLRLEKELMALSGIDGANSNGTCIIYKVESLSEYYRAIDFNSDSETITLNISTGADLNCASPGNILIERIAGMTVTYHDEAGVELSPPFDAGSLATVTIAVTVNRLDGGSENFSITINPRNLGDLNAPRLTG